MEELDRSWDAFKRVLKQHKHLTTNGLVPVHAVRRVSLPPINVKLRKLLRFDLQLIFTNPLITTDPDV